MPIRLENVGIAVRDLDATIAFFTDLGLTVPGRATGSGPWPDTGARPARPARPLPRASSSPAALGLTVLGRDAVSGQWTDTAVGLDGNHAKIAMLQTPDGNGRLELFEYIHPDATETED